MINKTVKFGNHRETKRVWLQGIAAYHWNVGQPIAIEYGAQTITITKAESGRKVSSPSKGGVIDISGAACLEFWKRIGQPEKASVSIETNKITITGA